MKPLGVLALAAQFAPRILQVRGSTWIALGVGMLTLFALMTWAAVALFGWLWSQGKSLSESAPEAVRIVATQVEKAIPGVRETLSGLVPALKPEPPPRDVSGTDIGPVPRYPGLARSHWLREGRETTVHYEGRADYGTVLDHYTRSFAAHGYVQSVKSATPETEAHDYRKGDEHVRFEIARLPHGKVKATIVAVLP